MKSSIFTMKKLLMSSFLLLVACAGGDTVEIGDPSVPSPEENQNYLTIHDAFTRHDTNADGYLDEHEYVQLETDPQIIRIRKSIAEIVTSGPLLFTEIDENEDGLITLNELTVMIQPLLPPKH